MEKRDAAKSTRKKTVFSNNLMYLMRLYHYKNVTLANKLRVSKSTISNYLSGLSTPPVDVLEKLSYIFCRPINVLLSHELNPTPSSNATMRSAAMEPSLFERVTTMVPYFHFCLTEAYDDIYVDDNFQSCFYFPFSIHGNSRCYAVKMPGTDSILSEGYSLGCIAIFARDEGSTPDDGDVVAVHIKKHAKIVIRKVEISDDGTMMFTSDIDKFEMPKGIENHDLEILGKVVYKLSNA